MHNLETVYKLCEDMSPSSSCMSHPIPDHHTLYMNLLLLDEVQL